MNTKPSRLAACLCAVAYLSLNLHGQETKEPASAPKSQLKVEGQAVGKPDPKALGIINRAADYLAKAKQYQATVEVSHDVVYGKKSKLQYTKQLEIKLRRPDRLQIEVSTTVPRRSFWYDGKNVTLFDHKENYYATAPAADKIDAMVDQVEKALGIAFPLDDLVLSKPLSEPASSAKNSAYLGKEKILGKVCHHVAFEHRAIDWQAWVEDGPKPLLRKVVITLKFEEGSPQITAFISNWDMGTKLPDYVFEFEAPKGAEAIKFMASTDTPGEQKAPATEVKSGN
ncbi:hypothetical protein DES53_12214 [Roseimicrobium gellanilyticum]|uniref:DUF2092 domain-containing protein n=1 Tax=Roseimicrobium gellanilyticum TaxID=748857 RepID=A0A366H256_9BACT|nr:DUF2092 domain-containing protein [Roseimicrobium gellanilyticum]RBP35347.1 hypothetical protein DES53_12214 [Roseimicrobium gellanilyticum]